MFNIALCSTRNLSRDRGVAPHVYINSGITRFINQLSSGLTKLNTLVGLPTGIGRINWNRFTIQWLWCYWQFVLSLSYERI